MGSDHSKYRHPVVSKNSAEGLDLTGSSCAKLNVVFDLENGVMSAFGQKRTSNEFPV